MRVLTYFLAFFAFFFFTIVSSFCSDLGKSEICLEPINGPNPLNSTSRDLFYTMVNNRGRDVTRPRLATTTAKGPRGLPRGSVGERSASWMGALLGIGCQQLRNLGAARWRQRAAPAWPDWRAFEAVVVSRYFCGRSAGNRLDQLKSRWRHFTLALAVSRRRPQPRSRSTSPQSYRPHGVSHARSLHAGATYARASWPKC
jgi:hypothetical protein